MRLIDADALIDEAIERYCADCDKRKGIKNGKWRIVYQIGDAPCRACSVDDMIDDLINAPTIDAVNHTADYDEKNDILFVHLSPYNSNSYGEEIDKNIIIMRDMDSDEITGVMLYGFNKYVKKGKRNETN